MIKQVFLGHHPEQDQLRLLVDGPLAKQNVTLSCRSETYESKMTISNARSPPIDLLPRQYMTNPHLQTALNETLQKVGRNVLVYQRLEALHKMFASISNVKGKVGSEEQSYQSNVDRVDRMTLGRLMKDFIKLHVTEDEPELEPADSDEFWISVSLYIDMDANQLEEEKGVLSALVEERNNLIHKDLAGLNTNSIDSCRQFSSRLDEQYERLYPVYEKFRRTNQLILAGYRTAVDKLKEASPE